MQSGINTKTRNETIEWLENLPTKYHLTLSFSFNVYERTATNLLNKFLKNLNRRILRDRYNKHDQFIDGLVVMESTPQMNNVHFHILIFDREDMLPSFERMEWIITKKIENTNKNEKPQNHITKFLLQEYTKPDESGHLEKYLTKNFELRSLGYEEKMNRLCPLDRAACSFGK